MPASAVESSPRDARAAKHATFQGKVRYRDGEPAVGLGVSWSPKGPFSVTDAEGRFTWEGKHRSATVFLDVGPEAYFPLGRMEVGPDGTGTLEIDRGFPVGGTVRAARGGSPLPGALVVLRRMGGHGTPSQGQGPSAKTDDAGRFSFRFIPEGSYSLLIRASGYEPLFRVIDVVRPMGGEAWLLGEAREMPVRIEAEGEAWEDATFVVQIERWQDRGYFDETRIAPEQRSGAKVPAPPPGWYRAELLLVSDKGLQGIGTHADLVVGSETTPVLTFRVPPGGPVRGVITVPGGRAAVLGQLLAAGFLANVETDQQGAFQVPFVPDGRYQIRVFCGTGFRYGSPFAVKGGANVDVRIDGAGEIDGQLDPAPRGSFENPVEITSASELVALVYHRDGAFRAEWLPPGRYSVRVAGELPIQVDLGEGESRDVGVLHAPAKVLLRLAVDVPTGAEPPELIQIGGDGVEETAMVLDTRGRGEVLWPAGRQTVHVRARGFKDATTEIVVEPDSPTAVRLALQRP